MKLYIETYGCAANQADSDAMRELLKKHRFVSEKDADVIIVNTCGVKGSTENKIFERLKKLRGKKVIVAGCLTKIIETKLKREFPEFSLIGPSQVSNIGRIVAQVAKGKRLVKLSGVPGKLVCLSRPKRIQPIIIGTGCLGFCAYCATKNARGQLKSYAIKDVVKAVRCAVKNGAETILLTAQDTGAYGIDLGTDLPKLLEAIVRIPGDFKVRVGMMNPNFALRFLDRLIAVYKNPKIIKFAHIPVQAGSNRVLKLMRRSYTVAQFKEVVKKFRREIPGIRMSTDIICGLPGESEKDFAETIKLVKWLKPEAINISKFYPRPGTEAKKMRQLPNSLIKDRSRRLSALMAGIRKI